MKAKRLLIYPYAHLTADLALPERALEVIMSIEKFARERFVDVHRAPFGWTKAFEIKVKGHPLAENYKIVTKQTSNIAPVVASSSDHIINSWETKVSSALREEEKLASICTSWSQTESCHLSKNTNSMPETKSACSSKLRNGQEEVNSRASQLMSD